jgi:phosphinothricin acetyltransferase
MTDTDANRRDCAAATLRPAKFSDIPAITQIYDHYVRETAFTFEVEAPDEIEMERRWGHLVGENYPYLIAESDGIVRGFAFVAPYKQRAAHAGTVEVSIYVSYDARGKGIGTKSFVELIAESEEKGYRQMIAGIADNDNDASLALHRKLRFGEIGRLKEAGCKFGRLIDVVLMQRALGGGE